MMTTQTQKTSTKQFLDVQVEVLYDKNDTKAFKVGIKEGKFIVMDYKDRFSKNPDTEIFWEYGMFQLQNYTSQYKSADKTVTDFLKRKKNS
jgi:hypothetical protein